MFLSENWKSYNIFNKNFSKGTISKIELTLIRNSNRSNNIVVLADGTSGYATASITFISYCRSPSEIL